MDSSTGYMNTVRVRRMDVTGAEVLTSVQNQIVKLFVPVLIMAAFVVVAIVLFGILSRDKDGDGNSIDRTS